MNYGLTRYSESRPRSRGERLSIDRLGSAITSRIISPRLPRQATQRRDDDFGARQAVRAAAFMARHRTAAPAITAGAPTSLKRGFRGGAGL